MQMLGLLSTDAKSCVVNMHSKILNTRPIYINIAYKISDSPKQNRLT